MEKIKQGIRGGRSAILAVCLVICFMGALAIPVEATGEGYSDMYRLYTISGVNSDNSVMAIGMLFGSDNNAPADNYAVIMKFSVKKDALAVDVMSGDKFQEMLNNSMSVSQTNIASYNEYMLSAGAPDEFLFINEQPEIVNTIKSAVTAGQSSVTVKDSLALLPDLLQLASQQGGTNFQIYVDTTKTKSKSVDVRMTVTPSKATKGIVTMATAEESNTAYLVEHYESRYNNKFAAIEFVQEGSFGTTVRVAAKVDLKKLNKDNLLFYSFDRFANTYKQLENPNYSIDGNGYLSFDTNYGGIMLITDKPLALK